MTEETRTHLIRSRLKLNFTGVDGHDFLGLGRLGDILDWRWSWRRRRRTCTSDLGSLSDIRTFSLQTDLTWD